jgi:hypothetical protein
MTGKKIGLKIASLPIVWMGVADASDIDLDGDGINDVRFIFNRLQNNMVDLTISQLSFEGVPTSPVENPDKEKFPEAAPSIPETIQLSAYVFTRDLKLGMSDDDVKALQKYLNASGFLVARSGNGSLENESTYFGMRTKLALIKFQKAHGISPAQGYFGRMTRKVVNGG